tara:strand:+ start:129 stop:974 length:846 start_codon:yes stop_codon:yes gene_type:complete
MGLLKVNRKGLLNPCTTVERFQSGGAIIVTDPNDHRLNAYKDSAEFHSRANNNFKRATYISDRPGGSFKIASRSGSPVDKKVYDLLKSETLKSLKNSGYEIGEPTLMEEAKKTIEKKGDHLLSLAVYKPQHDLFEDAEARGMLPNGSANIQWSTNIASYKKPVQPVFLKGSKEAEIVEKQRKLKDAGLYKGKIDGIWGSKSEDAWKDFKSSNTKSPDTKENKDVEKEKSPGEDIQGWVRNIYYDNESRTNKTELIPLAKGQPIPTNGTFVPKKRSGGIISF